MAPFAAKPPTERSHSLWEALAMPPKPKNAPKMFRGPRPPCGTSTLRCGMYKAQFTLVLPQRGIGYLSGFGLVGVTPRAPRPCCQPSLPHPPFVCVESTQGRVYVPSAKWHSVVSPTKQMWSQANICVRSLIVHSPYLCCTIRCVCFAYHSLFFHPLFNL